MKHLLSLLSRPCERPLSDYARGIRPLVWFAEGILALGRDVVSGEIGLRSMSLVYTTLLSLVPLLAFSLALLSGFGVHSRVEPMLLNLLSPLGDSAEQIASQIMAFVGNIKVGVLGSVGLGVLLYTVSSLIHKMIMAIDFTWNGHRERSFLQRLGIYLLMILLGPLVLFSLAGAISAAMEVGWVKSLLQSGLIGNAYEFLLNWTPLMMIVVMLTLIYWVLPGKRVHWYNALLGGIITAFAWKLLGLVFASVVVGSTKYTAIYSAFASVLLFIVWLHLSWLVLLLGSRLVYYLQHPWAMCVAEIPSKFSIRVVLLAFHHVVTAFYKQAGGISSDELASRLGVPDDWLQKILQPLIEHQLVVASGERVPRYLPARALDQVRLSEVVALLHDWRGGADIPSSMAEKSVARLLRRLDTVVDRDLGDETVEQWIRLSAEEAR